MRTWTIRLKVRRGNLVKSGTFVTRDYRTSASVVPVAPDDGAGRWVVSFDKGQASSCTIARAAPSCWSTTFRSTVENSPSSVARDLSRCERRRSGPHRWWSHRR